MLDPTTAGVDPHPAWMLFGDLVSIPMMGAYRIYGPTKSTDHPLSLQHL